MPTTLCGTTRPYSRSRRRSFWSCWPATTATSYRALFARYQIEPARFLMVGNSLRSDILPVTALGGRAVYIPYHMTWAHETVADQDAQLHQYVELEHIGGLPKLMEQL